MQGVHVMTRFTRRGLVALATAVVPFLMLAPPAAAATAGALWHMDESTGPLAHDSSGNGNDGMLFNVTLGRPGFVGSGFGFNGTDSKIVVQSSSSLNPGAQDFSYTAAVRLTVVPGVGDTYDVLRKGISSTTGGEYKMEVANVKGAARARCLAKDAAGHVAKVTHSKSLADGQWHVITCSRSGNAWSTTVDGVVKSGIVSLGSVSNSKVLTIGSKNGGKTGGDFYRGDLDEAAVSIG